MIHQRPDGEWVGDLLGEPSYCNVSWTPGNTGINIVSAGGNAEVDIDWRDVPRLVSDLLLVYEQARAANALTNNGTNLVPVAAANAAPPNLT